MLFVLNSAGVPSVARFVRLAPSGPPPPPTCSYALDNASWDYSLNGGETWLQVTTDSACAWNAVSDSSWLAITAGASGTGPGQITAQLQANTGPARVGHITVGGQVFEARQAGCSYALDNASWDYSANGGDTWLGVTTNSACAWNAVSDASWLAITAGASGTGPGQITARLEANTGPARVGHITVRGQVFEVRQAGSSAPPTPPPPTALVATAVSSSRIDSMWSDNAANETGFVIERCQGAGCNNFALLTPVGANTTSYSNTGLTASTSYSYRVAATNGAGTSAYSNTASATTPGTIPARRPA